MNKKYFIEKQKFTQLWLWLVLFFLSVLPILIEYLSSSKFSFHLAHLILPCVVALFYFLELRVCINEQGIYYQFFPFHLKSYVINYDEIESYLAVTYSPIIDYGGWGIRYGFKKKAYNVKGNHGVRINLKTGKAYTFWKSK
jgi:hypothetical protein